MSEWDQKKSMPECVICFEEVDVLCDSDPCGHAFCWNCSERHYMRTVKCPICRQPIAGIGPGGAGGLRIVAIPTSSEDDDDHVGLSLSNAPSGGVRVVRAARRKPAYRNGLRFGHVIRRVNGVPVGSHEDAIAIMNRAWELKRPIECHVEADDRWWTRWMRRARIVCV